MSRIYGLILVISISVLSYFLGKILTIEVLTIAILLGIIYGNTIGVHEKFKSGITFSLKKLLKLGIILLGFKLDIQSILKLGPMIIISVLIYVPITLLLAIYLGKLLGVDDKIATLIGVGSSICGASAIVAVAPGIHSGDDDTVISVSIISVLGAIGVLLYSLIASLSTISDTQFGIWSGLTLQGVAHAIAASYSRGEISGEIGTIVKLSRVLFLVPVSIILSYVFREDIEEKSKVKFPRYILFFIFTGIINTISVLPKDITSLFGTLSSLLILMSMTAMGLSVKSGDVKEKGYQSILLGLILFTIISSVSYFIILIIFD